MVRQLAVSDLPRLADCAREFYAASRFLRTFDMGRFKALWTQLIESGSGVVFGIEEDGALVGTIGGAIYPEAYSGDLIAQEFFWFTLPQFRGGLASIRLYRSFEQWARQKGCTEVRMGHLLDSMPEKMQRFYGRFGFIPVEVNFAKRLDGEPR